MCRTMMSPPETSADGLVVGSGVGTDDVSHREKILASFIAQSSAALAHPYFNPTSIFKDKYKMESVPPQWVVAHHFQRTKLLECELVSIRTNREDGLKSARLAWEKWIKFINRYGLRGDAEFADGAIKRSAIFDGISLSPRVF